MSIYSKAVIHSHLFVPKKEIENISVVKRSFTVRSKFDSSLAIETFRETENWFGFPRHTQRLTDGIAKKVVDKRTDGRPINLTDSINLWDYQKTAVDQITAHIKSGGTGFFLEAAPGSGKTVIGIKLIVDIGRTALVIVPKSDLVEQWINRFLEYTNIKRESIGIASGGVCEWEGKDIVIGLVHTVVLDRWSESFKKNFGVVLFDECDSSIPPTTFSPAACMFPARYRIGMTASSTRTDGLHKVFEDHICQFRVVCKKSNTLKPSIIMHYYKESSGTVPHYLVERMSRRGVLISHLASNPERNKLIAAYAHKSYEVKRPTLVISDRKEQLKEIHKILTSGYKIPPSKIGFYVRTLDNKTIKKKEKERIANDCEIILGTYGMIKRGTDIQRLSTLILATPQSDLRQTQGRIERFLEGKSTPVLVDIVDTFYPECSKSANYRLSQYRKSGLTIQSRGL